MVIGESIRENLLCTVQGDAFATTIRLADSLQPVPGLLVANIGPFAAYVLEILFKNVSADQFPQLRQTQYPATFRPHEKLVFVVQFVNNIGDCLFLVKSLAGELAEEFFLVYSQYP